MVGGRSTSRSGIGVVGVALMKGLLREPVWVARRSLSLLGPEDRRKYWLAVVALMSTSVLDLAGVLAFGLTGVALAAASQGTDLPDPIQSGLAWLGLGDSPVLMVTLALAGAASVLLIVKSVVSVFILLRVTRFLARCSADASAKLCAEFFALPLVHIRRLPSQRSVFALIHGVSGAVVISLTSAMVIAVELALLVVLSLSLLLLNPLITIFAIGYFGLAAFVMGRALKDWADRSGRVIADADVASATTIMDGLSTYREVTVANRRDFYVRRFESLRSEASRAYADQQFIGQFPRYAMEVALVLGGALLISALLVSTTVESALATLALFLAAGTRVMPSMLRLQGARITLRVMAPRAEYAYSMVDLISEASRDQRREPVEPQPERRDSVRTNDVSRPLGVVVSRLSITYPGSHSPALKDVTFTVSPGASLAIVGPTGGGKSTLADAILGLLEPSAGSVRIGGLLPTELTARHPGVVSYVPQSVAIVSGSVRDNVALGLSEDAVDDDRVWAALRQSHLADFVLRSEEGLSTPVGEHGFQMSGGQRQRLGIARALYLQPSLLVMDEATSALDAETEWLVTETLDGLGTGVTTVTIAHRLPTIRRADMVIYLDQGRLVTWGSFNDVRSRVPQFDRQARLLGL